MKTLNITFEDKDFKKLKNCAEEMKITDEKVNSWEDYFLKISGVKK